MRTSLFIAIAVLAAVPVSARAQQAAEGLACFDHMVTPDYPKAALQGNVDGSVWTNLNVDPQGNVQKVETEVVSAWSDGQKFLTPPVEKAVRTLKAKPECAGKKVTLVFRYQLHGEPTASPAVTSRTEPPDIVYIESRPETSDQTTSRR